MGTFNSIQSEIGICKVKEREKEEEEKVSYR